MFRRTDFKKIELFGCGKKNTKIFKIQHLKTGKIYVLKEVEAKNLDKLNEYKEEAVQLSRVQNHPNILQIYGYYFYETPHNTFKLGIINEYINHDLNLEIIFRNREKKGLFFKEDQLIRMMYSMIDAFAYLESVGICHRDIKPTNLFLMENYEMKIIDFGESKESFDEDHDDNSTMATIRGTPQYLSPILWVAHVITQAKQVEHNMYKSDVFSAGLVLIQMATMKDVNGFNHKTDKVDGERLIADRLRNLSKIYSNKVIDILRLMLLFDEGQRPNFLELGKIIGGKNYTPRTDLSIIGQIAESERNEKNRNSYTANNNTPAAPVKKEKSDEEKTFYFKQYMSKNNLRFNMQKTNFWFEYGGNMIGKFEVRRGQENIKWKLIGKYKGTFPCHAITVYINESYGYFIIGGTDSTNTLQYVGGQIIKKNSMNIERCFTSAVHIRGFILAIGGYEYNEKNQLNSIESYDIANDTWNLSVYQDLKVARSQANSMVFNEKYIYVFGGYNKNFGTLNTIERINYQTKGTELLDLKLPIPLRRFASLKITGTKILLMGGITRLCKETDSTFIIDFEKNSCSKYSPLPKGGIIDQEVIVDEIGQCHLFFENNYGTSPPIHTVYSYLDFN